MSEHKEGLLLCSQALCNNPYDLRQSLTKAEDISGTSIKKVFVDKGYRGHGIQDKEVVISGQKKGITRSIKKQ